MCFDSDLLGRRLKSLIVVILRCLSLDIRRVKHSKTMSERKKTLVAKGNCHENDSDSLHIRRDTPDLPGARGNCCLWQNGNTGRGLANVSARSWADGGRRRTIGRGIARSMVAAAPSTRSILVGRVPSFAFRRQLRAYRHGEDVVFRFFRRRFGHGSGHRYGGNALAVLCQWPGTSGARGLGRQDLLRRR